MTKGTQESLKFLAHIQWSFVEPLCLKNAKQNTDKFHFEAADAQDCRICTSSSFVVGVWFAEHLGCSAH